MPLITPESIAEIKERADMIAIVSEATILKKAGKEYKGLCPFHDDKNPSMSVNPSAKLYKCFSCGAGGDIIKFVQESQNKSFYEAVQYIADKSGVEVHYEQSPEGSKYQQQQSDKALLYEILAIASAFYQHQLHSPGGSKARQYLSDRRVSVEAIQSFSLGYAPDSWQSVYSYLVSQKGFDERLVEKAGLIVPRKSKGYYDRFRDRIMYPIHDVNGRIIAFGGRTLCGDDRKYINSPESEVFSKSHSWYGIHKAKEAIRKEDKVIIVEGYMDVISLQSSGIKNTVGSQGTAINPSRIKSILQFTESKELILNLDNDTAGTKAVERVIKDFEILAYKGDVNLKVLQLPCKDADSYLFDNTSHDYISLVNSSESWISWQLSNIINNVNPKDTEQELKVIERAGLLLSKIKKSHYLEIYLKKAVEMICKGDTSKFEYTKDSLRAVIGDKWKYNKDEKPPLVFTNKFSPVNRIKPKTKKELPVKKSNKTALYKAEKLLIQIYIFDPESRRSILCYVNTADVIFIHFSRLWVTVNRLLKTKGADIDISLYLKDDKELSHILSSYLPPKDEYPLLIYQSTRTMYVHKLHKKKSLLIDKLSKDDWSSLEERDRLHNMLIKVTKELREELST